MIDDNFISRLCIDKLFAKPDSIERCSVGIGNYVFTVCCGAAKYTVRCSKETKAYSDTVFLLEKLHAIDVPVPGVINCGQYDGFEYIILSFIPGRDLGLVYRDLGNEAKQTIAQQVAAIQKKVALLDLKPIEPDWKWQDFILENLDRSEHRITKNGYFDAAKVEQLRTQAEHLNAYFSSVNPVPYLDDLSTKNLLIDNGKVSGIIDIDWMGFGDSLTYIALTCVALLNMDCDTEYISYLLREINPSKAQVRAFVFYCLMFCVDFMGERGMSFNDKRIDVNSNIIKRLNDIYELLWRKWNELL